jgi:hypothetical protein
MAGESALTIRFGGDTAGLKSAVAVANAQLQGFQSELRKLAQEAAKSGEITNDNLTKAMREAAAGVAGAKRELESLSRSTQPAMSAAANSVAGFHKQLDRVTEFAWNNTNLSGNQIDRVANPIKGLSGAIGVVPTVATAAAAAVAALAFIVGNFADNQLAKLGEISKATGLDANTVEGAKIAGARAGVDQDAMVAGIKNAAAQFEQFRRNAGEVKDSLEKVDESFLKVADKAKTAGQFVDLVGQEIRKLPREEGIDLAKALFGDDTGQKLYEPIMRGQLEMAKLGAEAGAAGVKIDDGLVKGAEEAQRHIEEAATAAGGKLLTAIQALAPLVAEIKVGFYGVVGAIADTITKAKEFSTAIGDGVARLREALGLHQSGGKPFEEVFGGYRRARVNETGVPEDPPAPPSGFTGGGEAGASRARYAARDESGGGKAKGNSDALNEQRKEIEGEIQAVQQQTAINKQQYELDFANKKISEDEKKRLLQQADDDELAAIKTLYEQEKQLAGQKPAQIQDINNKIETLEAQHQLKMLQLQTKELQDAKRAIEQQTSQMVGTLTSSLSQAIVGAVEHTGTKDAGKKLAQSLFNDLVNELVKSTLTKPLETALQPLFQGLSTAISQPLQQGFQAAVNAMMQMIKPLINSLSSALGGIFSGLSGALGSLGGGGLALALPFLAEGTNYVPHDMVAMIHQGERVVPAADNRTLTSVLAGGGGVGGAASGGGHTFNTPISLTVQHYGSGELDHRQIASAVSKAAQRGVFLGMKGLS